MILGKNNVMPRHLNPQFDGANQDYPMLPIYRTVVTAFRRFYAFIID